MEWLFDICCKIMSGLGNILGLSYKEICVIGNIYIQGGIWILSALIPMIVLMLHQQTSCMKKLYLIFAIGYALIHSILFIIFCERYSFPITEGFNICVDDLQHIAKVYNTTYQAVNIYIFVIGWMLSIGWNVLITKLVVKNKMIWAFITMIISTLLLLIFMFTIVNFLFI